MGVGDVGGYFHGDALGCHVSQVDDTAAWGVVVAAGRVRSPNDDEIARRPGDGAGAAFDDLGIPPLRLAVDRLAAQIGEIVPLAELHGLDLDRVGRLHTGRRIGRHRRRGAGVG